MSQNIELIVDYREDKLINNLNIPFKSKSLNCGDLIFTENNHIKIMIERKTLNDLISSIHDGRFRDQKSRMLQDISPSNCLYILEGEYRNFTNGNLELINKTINSTIINLTLRDKINVIQTKDINHTVEIITSIYQKIIDNKLERESTTNCLVNNLKKKNNIDINTCFILQLSQIPGISINKAKIIQSHHHNLVEFINYLNKISEKKQYLIKMRFNNKGLGNKTADKLLHYLGFN